MEKNVGGIDRTARLLLGPILLIVAIAGFTGVISLSAAPQWGALVVGMLMTVTGTTQFCPLFKILGVSTASGGSSSSSEFESESSDPKVGD
jgi:hypothetical protein